MYGQQIYGYCRVSMKEQNEDRQVFAMREFGIPEKNIVVEKISGKDFNRPMYQRLVRKLKAEDVLVVKSIDRLGRNYEEIIEQWRRITKETEAAIVVIDMPLLDTRKKCRDLTSAFISDIVLQLLSYVSETEREHNLRRQAEGITAARIRGVRFGRPQKVPPKNFGSIVNKWEQKELTLAEALKRTGLKQTTFYKLLREYRHGKGAWASINND